MVHADQRPGASRRTPGNKLSETERLRILDVCNSPEFASLSPNIIVPTLADRGVYIASESTFYRVLNLANQLIRRTREHQYKRPEVLKAVAAYFHERRSLNNFHRDRVITFEQIAE